MKSDLVYYKIKSRFDVLVIGGGIMGSSTAHWLARKTNGQLKVKKSKTNRQQKVKKEKNRTTEGESSEKIMHLSGGKFELLV